MKKKHIHKVSAKGIMAWGRDECSCGIWIHLNQVFEIVWKRKKGKKIIVTK